MKYLLTNLLLITCFFTRAQSPITFYYDKDGSETAKEKAVYYMDCVHTDTFYSCKMYWIANNALRGKMNFTDTASTGKRIGNDVVYDRNGNLEDSSFYENGELRYQYHYKNKKLEAYYHVPPNEKEGITEAYDENGKKIKDYVFFREAQFKGGEKAWVSYLGKHLNKEFVSPTDQDMTLTVHILFVVDENGFVTRTKIDKSCGYKNIDNDALQVVSAGPQWMPAMLYNKPVKAYRKQPITYNVFPMPKEKKKGKG